MSNPGVSADAAPAFAICVPARNEATRLPRLFDALERLALPSRAAVTICLLLDSCTDDSAAITATFAARARFPIHVAARSGAVANAGIARHAAMMLGIAALGDPNGILLSTDADSWPRVDWLDATMTALDAADLVAGDVRRGGAQRDHAQDRIEVYYAGLHALRRRVDPVAWETSATHHHASGANMAMRVATYSAMGGFAPLPNGEDARLLDDAARAGFRVRRDAASVVHTSARRQGRALGGLAAALHALDRTGLAGVRVTHPVDQLWQYRHQALARRVFTTGDLTGLAATVGLGVDHLHGVARDCPNAEAFAMRVVPEAPGGMRQVPLTVAESALAALAADTTPARAA